MDAIQHHGAQERRDGGGYFQPRVSPVTSVAFVRLSHYDWLVQLVVFPSYQIFANRPDVAVFPAIRAGYRERYGLGGGAEWIRTLGIGF